MNVLVCEDGFEYIETLQRFLPELVWTRAGGGPAALQALTEGSFDALFLDMRFDRVPDEQLLGDLVAAADRFNGDSVQARHFLQDHQGTFVLAAVREAGWTLPVLMSYDFTDEPRRWSRLSTRFNPIDFLPDNAVPTDIRAKLNAMMPE
ncbi:MAG: CheY-like chemotaxis protein [Kiritimatiellia bacterium]|jgi:CheY-like chemotaxis protein